MADLNKTTVADIEAADVVMTTNNVLNSNLYFPRLARLAGGREFPSLNRARLFQDIYRENCEKLRARVRQLKGEGSAVALASIKEDLARVAAEADLSEGGDVGAKLGNTAKRLSLGKKATYRAEKAAAKGPSINDVMLIFRVFGPPSPVTHSRNLSVLFVTHWVTPPEA